ncbi:hypothetical protein D3C79_959710 [compost metagenome]
MVTFTDIQRRLQAAIQYPGCEIRQHIGDHFTQVDKGGGTLTEARLDAGEGQQLVDHPGQPVDTAN